MPCYHLCLSHTGLSPFSELGILYVLQNTQINSRKQELLPHFTEKKGTETQNKPLPKVTELKNDQIMIEHTTQVCHIFFNFF